MSRYGARGGPDESEVLRAFRANRALADLPSDSYTLEEESGASLRSVGAKVVGQVQGKEWSVPRRKQRSQDVYGKAMAKGKPCTRFSFVFHNSIDRARGS